MEHPRLLALTRTAIPKHVRYVQFTLLLLAAGAIYPLLYLRENFEITILSSVNMGITELSQCYSLMGLTFFFSYLPGGWLADRFSPRNLISFSLVMVGLLGLWFSTFPPASTLKLIFVGWGLSAGLTFWASLIKGIKILAAANEQSRFFGLLDGGRALVEAMLASIALTIFISRIKQGGTASLALQHVIYMYSITCFAIALLVFMFLKIEAITTEQKARQRSTLLSDLKTVLAIPQVWLMALIIFCGYQLTWATYSFSAYLQQGFGFTSIAVGLMMMSRLWISAIGGIAGGFLGDHFSKETILGYCQLIASAGLLWLAMFPKTASVPILIGLVLLISIFTSAVRGLYWSLLNACQLPEKLTGLAIGLISLIAYLPDMFLPLLNVEINEYYPDMGYQFYFAYIAFCGFVGAMATFRFKEGVRK